jgi:hypothetical protein
VPHSLSKQNEKCVTGSLHMQCLHNVTAPKRLKITGGPHGFHALSIGYSTANALFGGALQGSQASVHGGSPQLFPSLPALQTTPFLAFLPVAPE